MAIMQGTSSHATSHKHLGFVLQVISPGALHVQMEQPSSNSSVSPTATVWPVSGWKQESPHPPGAPRFRNNQTEDLRELPRPTRVINGEWQGPEVSAAIIGPINRHDGVQRHVTLGLNVERATVRKRNGDSVHLTRRVEAERRAYQTITGADTCRRDSGEVLGGCENRQRGCPIRGGPEFVGLHTGSGKRKKRKSQWQWQWQWL
ncbi:MAG: hypothetical protein ACI9OJ_001766 [Myxococcota bacterium]|jgi:hypothetical protein